MTTNEFSDMFTTLLNSYNKRADFGDQASKLDIVLDEYEKSVLLTQAQDIIVKSYFDMEMNREGKGFDDSIRRQMDFSNLISVRNLKPCTNTGGLVTGASTDEFMFDHRGLLYQLPTKEDGNLDVLYILNEKLISTNQITSVVGRKYKRNNGIKVPATTATQADAVNGYQTESITAADIPDLANWVATKEYYVIVPINYKEYDREMSKPFAQPLKKQAWRLIQNVATGFDMITELIPKHNVKSGVDSFKTKTSEGFLVTINISRSFIYKIRYVRRPRPIILEDLPSGLTIDGATIRTECELNPIIHMDILNKAVELAIATRGGSAPERGQFPANNMMGQNN